MKARLASTAAMALIELMLASSGSARAAADSRSELAAGFSDPPASARPRVWWHWMNGNITEDGLIKDLEWMHRVGLGGATVFDINLATPKIVDQRLRYMSPEWTRAFRVAVAKARDLGLEFSISSSPGWSESGGPWVEPQDAMKKLVWSQITVAGASRFTGVLPAPPSNSGPYQDMPYVDDMAVLSGDPPPQTSPYYRDVAVLAYPLTQALAPLPTVIESGGARFDVAKLNDEKFAETQPLPQAAKNEPPSPIDIRYDHPVTVRSASLFIQNVTGTLGSTVLNAQLEAEGLDGAWTPVATLPLSAVPTTVSFTPVAASRFRITFAPAPPSADPAAYATAAPTPGIDLAFLGPVLSVGAPRGAPALAELRLSAEPSVNRSEEKGAFDLPNDYFDLPQGPADAGPPASAVIDLTSKVKADGALDWTPSAGTWRILRLGYSLTGSTNHPATAEATGLEVDKYDDRAVRAYANHYFASYGQALGGERLGDLGIGAVTMDSTEVGPSNWTPDLIARFRSARGYDPTPFLPTLTGALIGSRETTDRFLYDFRLTLSELHARDHYGVFADVAHENKMIVYSEALEFGRPTLGDDMDMRRFDDRPMAAMWSYGQEPQNAPTLPPVADLKGAASVAHLYGRTAVAAESGSSMVEPWSYAPSGLRRVFDFEFANGVNLPTIHESAHQPTEDRLPGLSLGIFGQFFNRHESWAEMARPWIDYIARSSYLLQQGRDVADVAYFYGEEAPLTALAADEKLPDLPIANAYDFVNKTALLEALDVKDGRLVSKAGASYRILYLGGSSRRMTLAVLQRIADLARRGATIVGRAPTDSPSLADDQAAFAALAKTLWSGANVTQVGRGRVIAGANPDTALAQLGATPDFAYSGAKADARILEVHRGLRRGDIYFLNNRRPHAEDVEARFRVSGLKPEIWRADTGAIEPASYRMDGGVTVVPLHFAPEDSFFVVFTQPTTIAQTTILAPRSTPIATVDGPWEVHFQPGRGAPERIQLTALQSLSKNPEPGVKYFSGESTYTTTFTLARAASPRGKLLLDLGQVADLAEVRVNGTAVGASWHAPFQVDIAKAVKPGVNRLEVRVANRWVNRLIGDVQPGAQRVTYTTFTPFLPNAPLLPSGLIGPVTLEAEHALASASQGPGGR